MLDWSSWSSPCIRSCKYECTACTEHHAHPPTVRPVLPCTHIKSNARYINTHTLSVTFAMEYVVLGPDVHATADSRAMCTRNLQVHLPCACWMLLHLCRCTLCTAIATADTCSQRIAMSCYWERRRARIDFDRARTRLAQSRLHALPLLAGHLRAKCDEKQIADTPNHTIIEGFHLNVDHITYGRYGRLLSTLTSKRPKCIWSTLR